MNRYQFAPDVGPAAWWDSLDDLARVGWLNQEIEYRGGFEYLARRDPIIRTRYADLDAQTRRDVDAAYAAHLEMNG